MTTPHTPVQDLPCFGITYGVSGLGKTTDQLYAFPRGYYIATPAALKPSVGVVGFNLAQGQIWEAPRISAVTAMLPKLGPEFDAVVVDDFSLLAERTFSALEKSKSGFKLWGALRDEVLDFRDAARAHKKHVILNCHELPPQTKNGRYIRGGPKLPSTLPEDLPVQCDLVLRAYSEPTRKGPWAVVYRCGLADPSYVTKDRLNVTPDMAPMNIGEIMRAMGYSLRRAPGLEWIDAVVEQLAQALYANKANLAVAQPQIIQQAMQYIIDAKLSQNPLHIRWAIRDGIDRATLRIAKENVLGAFFT